MTTANQSSGNFIYKKYTAIIIIILVSAGVYLNCISNEFLYDDKALVINNELIRNVKNIPAFFSRDIWPAVGENTSNYFRPLIYIIFSINYYFAGLSAPFFHSVNIFFNTGSALILFLIVSHLVKNANSLFLPFASAVLFALHPVHTEAVAWVSGLPDISSTFFFLLAFYFFIRTDNSFGLTHFLSAFFFLTALLCKEPAIMFPAIFIAYDFFFSKKENGFVDYIKKYSLYAVVLVFYFILRAGTISGFTPAEKHSELTSYELILNIFSLFVSYIKKLILPLNLNVYYVFHPVKSLTETMELISVFFTLFYFTLIFFLRRKNPLLFFSLLWIAVTLLPSLYIPALGENVFAERYLYLPSAGFAIITALAISKIPSFEISDKKTIASSITALLLICIFYSAETVQRNNVWKNEMTLWSDTVKKSPDGAIPHNNFAIVLRNEGNTDEAIRHYQIAVKLRPDYFDAHYNLAVAYHLSRNLDDAEREYRIALSLNPNNPFIYNNLGSLFMGKGLFEDAANEYKKALTLKPDLEIAERNLEKTIIRAEKTASLRSLPN